MAALSAAMHDPDLQRAFLRLKAVGKSHKVAIKRKLIVLVNVLLRDACPWPKPGRQPAQAHAQPVDNLWGFCEKLSSTPARKRIIA